jgi:hypothetical protein
MMDWWVVFRSIVARFTPLAAGPERATTKRMWLGYGQNHSHVAVNVAGVHVERHLPECCRVDTESSNVTTMEPRSEKQPRERMEHRAAHVARTNKIMFRFRSDGQRLCADEEKLPMMWKQRTYW